MMFVATVKRYVVFVKWLLAISIFKNKMLFLVIVISGALGVLFQVNVFAMILYYARHFASGDLIELFGYTLNPRESPKLLLIFGILITLSLMLAYFFAYISNKYSLYMGRRIEEQLSKETLFMLGTSLNFVFEKGNLLSQERYILRLIRGDVRWANRVTIYLMRLMTPALTFLFAIIVLFYQEQELTFVLMVFIILFGYIQYKISINAAYYSRTHEKIRPYATATLQSIVNKYKTQSQHETDYKLHNSIFKYGPVKEQLDAFFGRLNSIGQSSLATGFFLSIILGLTLLVMGSSIMREGTGWGRLFVYLIALRFALVNLQSLFAGITSINRYYPQVNRIFYFLKRHSISEQYQEYQEFTVKIPRPFLTESLNSMRLHNGKRIALVTPTKLNRYTMTSIMGTLIEKSINKLNVITSVDYLYEDLANPEKPLKDYLNLKKNITWLDITKYFPSYDLFQKIERYFPHKLDTIITHNVWEKLNSKTRLLLRLISAINSDNQWLLVDAKAFNQINKNIRSFYLEMLKNKIVVFVFNHNFNRLGRFDEDTVCVSDGFVLLGLGPLEWFASVQEEVEQLFMDGHNKKNVEEDDDEFC